MQIKILIDYKNDVNLFKKGLLDLEYKNKWPHIEQGLFNMFPNLKDQLQVSEDKIDSIDHYVESLFDIYKNNLNMIVSQLQLDFDKLHEGIFYGLETSMDYKFDSNSIFNIYLSFLPSSTYNKNSANLAIYGYLKGIKTKDYIDIFIHEMSHIIFEEKAKYLYEKINKLDSSSHHCLKEIMAPVIIRDDIFNNILQSEYCKFANTQQQYLNIKKQGKIYNIVDYFELIYKKGKKNGLNFDDILIECILIIGKIQIQIHEKTIFFRNLYNGKDLNSDEFKDILIKNGYSNPIEL